MLRIEITTPVCAEGEAHIHEVALDADKYELFMAIQLLYPDTTCIVMMVVEDGEAA